jgi:glycosyltransferase involved in cell wall biosynthesis
MKKDQILIVSITKLDNTVIETIAQSTDIKCCELYKYTVPDRMSSMKRHIDCIVLAFKAVALRNKYSNLIFWQQFIGLYYNLFCFIFLIGKFPKSIILSVIYIRRYSSLGKLFHMFFKLAFRSKYIHQLVCHSISERQYYLNEFGIDLEEKIIFCHLGEGLPYEDCLSIPDKKYFFSGGSSNRDYDTLIKVFAELDEQLIIACKPENINSAAIPPNVTIEHEAYNGQFNTLIENAYAVILTIADPNISSGQLVLLKAMRLGKSTIVTSGNCMADYIDRTYSMEVPAKSINELKEAVIFLSSHPDQNYSMSAHAYKKFINNYTIGRYADRIAGIITKHTDTDK